MIRAHPALPPRPAVSYKPPALTRPTIDLSVGPVKWADFDSRWNRFKVGINIPNSKATTTPQLHHRGPQQGSLQNHPEYKQPQRLGSPRPVEGVGGDSDGERDKTRQSTQRVSSAGRAILPFLGTCPRPHDRLQLHAGMRPRHPRGHRMGNKRLRRR